jgi:hypothetical protein
MHGRCYCGAIPGPAAPQAHTFAANRVRWRHLCDGLPAYPRLRAEGLGAQPQNE